MKKEETYLISDDLAESIKCWSRTIDSNLKNSVLLDSVHHIRPPDDRKQLSLWEHAHDDLYKFSMELTIASVRSGGVANGTY